MVSTITDTFSLNKGIVQLCMSSDSGVEIQERLLIDWLTHKF